MRSHHILSGGSGRLLGPFLLCNWVAKAALVLGSLLTAVASIYVAETTQRENADYFERRVAEAHATVTQYLRMNLEVLRGLQGLFLQAGERPMARDEFRRYTQHLDLEGRYPGIRALSFTRYLRSDQLAAHEAAIRRDPALRRHEFAVKPGGARPDYFVVDFISPGNKGDDAMFGVDLGAEPTRRETLERARDTGLPAASRRITLTMRDNGPPGFFVAAPVYRAGLPLTSVDERRRAFMGCVTAVFGSDELFSHLFGAPLLNELDIEIYAAPAGTDSYTGENLLFDSAVEVAGHAVALHAPIEGGRFRQTHRIGVVDQEWSVVYTALPSLTAGTSRNLLPALVAGGGGALTLLLMALICSYSRANRQLASEVAERTAALVATQAEGAVSAAKLSSATHDLEQARTQLLQAEKMSSLGQLAAGVAHEINNPIGFIHSNLGSLKGQVEDLLRILDAYAETDPLVAARPELQARIQAAKDAADLEFIRQDIGDLIRESLDGAQRVKKIVEDLKNFSRADSGEWHPANVEHGIDSTLNIVWNELKYKAEVVKHYGGVPDIECIGSQLDQVFMNLLVNAAHAIETRGTITIRTGAEAASVWIEVADTGKGIPPENVTRIFEPFFTTKPVGQGTGLGLAVVHGIVERHGGHIEVDSEVGRGTRFRVTLPRHRCDPVVDPESGPAGDRVASGEHRDNACA